VTDGLRDLWIAEMWPVVRELSRDDRQVQTAMSDTFRAYPHLAYRGVDNKPDVCETEQR